MDEITMLNALKTDLGITTKAYDERLVQYLRAARDAIAIEGIKLTDSEGDSLLVVRYAAFLWNKRDTGDSMPRSLRWMLNNRLFSQKLQEE